MTNLEYISKIQEMQRLPIQTRVRAIYNAEILETAVFEIFWSGFRFNGISYPDWIEVGRQFKPFSSGAEFYWNEILE